MNDCVQKIDYGRAILAGFDHLLTENKDVFVIGQGPWVSMVCEAIQ